MTENFPDEPVEIYSPSLPEKHSPARQPRGLMAITLCEAWIAYCLYGFGALLVLYAADHILRPEIAPTVIGLGPFSQLLQWIFGTTSTSGLAAEISSAYLMCAFLWPIAAGIIIDLLLGFRNAFIIGMVLICAGFLLLASSATFLFALLSLILGFGLIRAMLPAQLGQLYDHDDPRRADGYQIFCLGLQFTGIIAPLAGGLTEKYYGWGPAFLVLSLGAPLGALFYWLGWKHLPKASSRQKKGVRIGLSREDRRALLVIALFLPALAVSSVPNSQMMSAYELWGGQHFALSLFGYTLPVSSLISLDGIASVATGFMILWLWRVWGRYRRVPEEMAKVVIGGIITPLGPLALMAGAYFGPGLHEVNLWWAIAFHFLNDFGFGLSQATGMALVAKLAPGPIRTSVISFYPFSSFLSQLLAGRLASLLGTMGSIPFWGLHMAASILGAIMFIAIYLTFRDVFKEDASIDVSLKVRQPSLP